MFGQLNCSPGSNAFLLNFHFIMKRWSFWPVKKNFFCHWNLLSILKWTQGKRLNMKQFYFSGGNNFKQIISAIFVPKIQEKFGILGNHFLLQWKRQLPNEERVKSSTWYTRFCTFQANTEKWEDSGKFHVSINMVTRTAVTPSVAVQMSLLRSSTYSHD